MTLREVVHDHFSLPTLCQAFFRKICFWRQLCILTDHVSLLLIHNNRYGPFLQAVYKSSTFPPWISCHLLAVPLRSVKTGISTICLPNFFSSLPFPSFCFPGRHSSIYASRQHIPQLVSDRRDSPGSALRAHSHSEPFTTAALPTPGKHPGMDQLGG